MSDTRELLEEAGRAIKYGATLDEWNDLEQRIQAHLASLPAEAEQQERLGYAKPGHATCPERVHPNQTKGAKPCPSKTTAGLLFPRPER